MVKEFMDNVHGKYMVRNLLTDPQKSLADSMKTMAIAQRTSVSPQKATHSMHIVSVNLKKIL